MNNQSLIYVDLAQIPKLQIYIKEFKKQRKYLELTHYIIRIIQTAIKQSSNEKIDINIYCLGATHKNIDIRFIVSITKLLKKLFKNHMHSWTFYDLPTFFKHVIQSIKIIIDKETYNQIKFKKTQSSSSVSEE